MAILGGALRFQDSCEEAGERPHAASLKSLAPKLLTVCVILCSMSFAGCARNPAQREVSPALHEGKASPVRAPVRTRRYSEPYRYAEPKIRRPDLALLVTAARPRLRVQTIRPQDRRSG